jgi:glycosyltransferase involved in cell wall biosynthesis
MQAKSALSVVIITLNEEENIARAIKSVNWAHEVVIVDSGSQDRTQEIAKSLGVKVVTNTWQGYGQQKNFALTQVQSDWVLFLDADEEVSTALREELQLFLKNDGVVDGQQYWGASIPRLTQYLGRWIRHGGWYPNALTRMVHRAHDAKWTEPAVHEALQVNGSVYSCKADIFHYTFRNVGDQVITNVRFSRLGAEVARSRGQSGSLLKIFGKPIGKFLETYVWKCGFLDGLPGLVISINAAHSIFMKYVELRFGKDTSRK